MCHTLADVTIGTVVAASTQELERPFIDTIVVGDTGAVRVLAPPIEPRAIRGFGEHQKSPAISGGGFSFRGLPCGSDQTSLSA